VADGLIRPLSFPRPGAVRLEGSEAPTRPAVSRDVAGIEDGAGERFPGAAQRSARPPLAELLGEPATPQWVYVISRVDSSGRVSDGSVVRAAGWGPGDRLTLRGWRDEAVIVRRDGGGPVVVSSKGLLVMVVFVPPSPDAPHVVGEKNEMGVPYRDGTDTRWMTENLLERAYRDRFSRRADDWAALEGLIHGLLPEIARESGIWVGASAHPVAPVLPVLVRPEHERAVSTMLDMFELSAEISGITGNSLNGIRVLPQLPDSTVANPRSELRRWVFRSNHYSTNPHEFVDWGVVELHHDGSVALAVRLDEFLPKLKDEHETGVGRVPTRIMDALMAEAVTLAAAHVRGLGGVGTNLIRA
jgi:hypothetical protein